MKYKVGDKVKVRSDLVVGMYYGSDDFIHDMRPKLGQIAEISRVLGDSKKYKIKDSPWTWTDEMFEGLEDGKMYASELMELARKEPEKYEGKRYKVLGLCCIGPESQFYGEVIVDSEGKLQCKGYDNWAYINSNTELEEIKPEPKPVPFMEAVKAYSEGKTIRCEWQGTAHTYSYPQPFQPCWLRDNNDICIGHYEILHGKWYIID